MTTIRMTEGDIRNGAMLQALLHLGNRSFPKIGTSFALARLLRAIRREAKLSHEVLQQKADRFIEKDENGKPKLAKDKNGNDILGTYNIAKEKHAEWDEAIRDFDSQEVVLKDVRKLKTEELESAGLTPNQIIALAPVLEERVDTQMVLPLKELTPSDPA